MTAQLERDCRQYFEEAFGRAFHAGRTTQTRTVPVNVDITPARPVAS